MLDEQTYKMHEDALEGRVFYENKLAEPENVEKYFPRIEGQDMKLYKQAPKISFPITADVINRIIALIHSDMKIECDSVPVDTVLQERLDKLEWETLSRKFLAQSMSEGNFLEVPRFGNKGIYYQNWGGEYFYRDVIADTDKIGYVYVLNKDGTMSPLTCAPAKDANIRSTQITETTWDGVEHGLDFNPATYFRCVDVDKDNRYGKGYYLRGKGQILEYNQVFSQASKAVKILQNVWKTSLDRENPSATISLIPDKLNHVGKEGVLEQVIRELSIQPETEILDRVKAHIAASFQVPDFMTGLRDVGKIESGVALAIVSAPLQEIVARIKFEYKPKVIEFLTKDIKLTYAFHGKRAPNFALSVEFGGSVIPMDIQAELKNIYDAVDRGIITAEEGRIVALPLLKLQSLLEAKPVLN